MEANFLEILAKYRMVVGYLGEKEQFGWWQSSFFTSGSDAFLSPLFSRTKVLAQCNGVTRAAALVHDERIGVGHVYHMFRLPEEIEQGIHQALHDQDLGRTLEKMAANREAALKYLRQQAGTTESNGIGPIRVGDTGALRVLSAWHLVASLYYHAFTTGEAIFPYFSDLLK